MKQTGFTLIELLGVIALLGILALIAIPAIDRSLNSSKDKLETTQNNQIVKGAKDYYAEHLSDLPKNSNDSTQITIGKLKEQGYLPVEIVNPKTGEPYDDVKTVVIVTKNDNNYDYKVKINE